MLMNHSITQEKTPAQSASRKEYQSPILCKLDGNEIQGGNTRVIAENSSGGQGWIVSGS